MRTIRRSSRLLGGVSAPGGVCSQGQSVPEGGLLQGVSAPGVSTQGVCIPACTEADNPPLNRMTDRCKSITFAKLRLRPVISLGAVNFDV